MRKMSSTKATSVAIISFVWQGKVQPEMGLVKELLHFLGLFHMEQKLVLEHQHGAGVWLAAAGISSVKLLGSDKMS